MTASDNEIGFVTCAWGAHGCIDNGIYEKASEYGWQRCRADRQAIFHFKRDTAEVRIAGNYRVLGPDSVLKITKGADVEVRRTMGSIDEVAILPERAYDDAKEIFGAAESNAPVEEAYKIDPEYGPEVYLVRFPQDGSYVAVAAQPMTHFKDGFIFPEADAGLIDKKLFIPKKA